jgi:hypothetical protein
MASESEAPNTRISNWTLATGTSPGQRQASAAANPIPSRAAAPEGQS